MTLLMAAREVSAGYNGVPAIRQVSLEVTAGEIALLAGPNGAGKTTMLMTLAGGIDPLEGHVEFVGSRTTLPLYRRCRHGLGVITEDRDVFPGLTVFENLRLGRGKPEAALEHFPELRARLKVKAGLISGGEQQMLALGRVLAAEPRVILADELSLGLAPIAVQRLLVALRAAADNGAGVLMVEQQVRRALGVADRVYFMRRGALVSSDTAANVRGNEAQLRAMYL
jgi:branched-chain amino acid transport system ATP-binding protein